MTKKQHAAMASGTQNLILKVLSGAQFGVEISLADGEYSFGSGTEADIQFTDLSMADLHGAARVGSGKIELKAMGGQLVTTSGLVIEPGEEAWHEVAQLDQVTAGTSVFAIGARDAKWASLTAVTAPATGAATTRSAQGRAGAPVTSVIAAGGVIAACVFGALYFTGTTPPTDLVSRSLPQDEFAAVQNAIDTLPFSHALRAEEQADGIVFVTGHVDSAAQRRAVQNALRDTGAQVRPRIWALDAMRADIAGLIDSQSIAVDHELSNRGILTLSGSNLDAEAVTRAIDLLQGEVFGLAGVQNNVDTADTYLEKTKALVDRVQLSELVLARLDGALIETTGVVPTDKTDNWAGFMRAYSRQIAPHIPLRSFVTLEGQPQSDLPVILSAQNAPQTEPGRQLPLSSVTDDTVNPSELFASTPDAAQQTGTPELNAAVIDREAVQLVETFAANNPELVSELIVSLTDGAADDIDSLRALIANANAAPDPSAPRLGQGDADTQGPNAADGPGAPGDQGSPGTQGPVSPLNALLSRDFEPPEAASPSDAPTQDAATDSTAQTTGQTTAQSDRETATQASVSAQPGSASPPQEASNTAATAPQERRIAGFLPVPTAFRTDEALARLQAATSVLFSSDLNTPLLNPDVAAAQPELGNVPLELVRLANAQTLALEFGETLLAAPRPISALPVLQNAKDRCWQGSHITLESLPTVLLWMDILSVSTDVDISQIDPDNRLLFLEAGMNPAALARCLTESGDAYGAALLNASAYLQESQRNESFSEFIFRTVPVFDIAVKGTRLSGDRYVQIATGRKLREGSAPTPESRLVSIGEKGMIFRVAEGYEVALYPETLSWRVAEN